MVGVTQQTRDKVKKKIVRRSTTDLSSEDKPFDYAG